MNVSAASPTGVNSWDGGAAPAEYTFTWAVPGGYIGLGSWTSSPGTTLNFDNVTAGLVP